MPLPSHGRAQRRPSSIRAVTTSVDTSDDLAVALACVEQAAEAPQAVLARALPLLGQPEGFGAEAMSVLHRAVALSLRVLDRPTEAARHARLALGAARRAKHDGRAAEAGLTLALCLFQCGQTTAALAEAGRAGDLAPAGLRAQVLGQHGILLERLGRLDEAIARYGEALAAEPGPLDRARLLNNRAIALAYTGHFGAAVADLGDALRNASEAPMLAAQFTHNLGFVLALSGDVPAALARFDDADEAFERLQAPIGVNLMGRARALARANLHAEARVAAARAVDELSAGGAAADAAEARVLLAIAALDDGDVDAAIAAANHARRSLRAQGRPALAAVADHVVVRARFERGQYNRRALLAAARCADDLAGVGLVGDELDARLTAGLIARKLGDRDEALRHLDAVRSRRLDGPLVERARAWHAEAVYQLDAGDRAGAAAAAAAGLDTVAELQSLMGATELRVGAAGHGAQLASVGLRVALGDGDPWAALGCIDRWRATSLGLTQTPPDDVELAASLRALRAATVRSQAAAADDGNPELARRLVTELERRVRQRARHLAGATRGGVPAVLDRDELVGALGPAALVAYVEVDGRLGAVSLADGQATLHLDLGLDTIAATLLVESTLFALRRLTRPGPPVAARRRPNRPAPADSAPRRAAAAALEHSLAQLDDALLSPLGLDPDRPLLVCPTGALHAAAWSAMPSARSRPIAVIPTLRVALRPRRAAGAGRPAVLAAGPGLGGALSELDLLRRVYPKAAVFGPGEAHVERVLAALEGAPAAHLACHGCFRADNPMFSALDLTDGPLTVFDVEQLDRPPAVVVLAACDVGTSAVSAGDELVGLAAALLRAGTESVIASLVPVPDESVVGFMGDLHAELAAGGAPAHALAAARAALDATDPSSLALRASFTCLGSG